MGNNTTMKEKRAGMIKRLELKALGVISKGYGFLRKRERDWKVTVMRSSSDLSETLGGLRVGTEQTE